MTNEEIIRSVKQRKDFALLLTSTLAPVFGWLYAGQTGAFCAFAAWIVFVVMPRRTDMRPFGSIYRGFLTPEQLPWTMVNITLAIIVGCMQFGIDVAFYAALIGVPIVILTLIVTTLEPDPEGQAVPIAVQVEGQAINHPRRLANGSPPSVAAALDTDFRDLN